MICRLVMISVKWEHEQFSESCSFLLCVHSQEKWNINRVTQKAINVLLTKDEVLFSVCSAAVGLLLKTAPHEKLSGQNPFASRHLDDVEWCSCQNIFFSLSGIQKTLGRHIWNYFILLFNTILCELYIYIYYYIKYVMM